VSEIGVEFLKRDQPIGALKEAAYRLIGTASCQIQSTEDRYVCLLSPTEVRKSSAVDIKARFLDLVTDENLREKIEEQTRPTRNLILALAFGALADQAEAAET